MAGYRAPYETKGDVKARKAKIADLVSTAGDEVPEDFVQPDQVAAIGERGGVPTVEKIDRSRDATTWGAVGQPDGVGSVTSVAPEDLSMEGEEAGMLAHQAFLDGQDLPGESTESIVKDAMFDKTKPAMWGGGGGYNYEYAPGANGEPGPITVSAAKGSGNETTEGRAQRGWGLTVQPGTPLYAKIMEERSRGDITALHSAQGAPALPAAARAPAPSAQAPAEPPVEVLAEEVPAEEAPAEEAPAPVEATPAADLPQSDLEPYEGVPQQEAAAPPPEAAADPGDFSALDDDALAADLANTKAQFDKLKALTASSTGFSLPLPGFANAREDRALFDMSRRMQDIRRELRARQNTARHQAQADRAAATQAQAEEIMNAYRSRG